MTTNRIPSRQNPRLNHLVLAGLTRRIAGRIKDDAPPKSGRKFRSELPGSKPEETSAACECRPVWVDSAAQTRKEAEGQDNRCV